MLPRAPESAIMKMGLNSSRLSWRALVTSLMVSSHWRDGEAVALVVGDKAALILPVDLDDFLLGLGQ